MDIARQTWRAAVVFGALIGWFALVSTAVLVVCFVLGVTGVLEEEFFHRNLIQFFSAAQYAVMWMVGPPG